MMMVVRGRATMRPMKPKIVPQTDKDKSNTAGLSPIALPIIFGVTIMSVIICTTANKPTANPNITQKF